MPTYTYDAFISYRHMLPDKAVAKKLHTLIETYRIPTDVRKTSGRKKMGRVFRDGGTAPTAGAGGTHRKRQLVRVPPRQRDRSGAVSKINL